MSTTPNSATCSMSCGSLTRPMPKGPMTMPAARLPSAPQLNRNPLQICRDAEAAGMSPVDYVTQSLKDRTAYVQAETPRIVTLLVERVDIGEGGLHVRLRMDGLGGLAREMLAGEMGAAA